MVLFLLNKFIEDIKLSHANNNKLRERLINIKHQEKVNKNSYPWTLSKTVEISESFFFNNFEAFDLIEGISTNGKNYDFVLHKIWVDSCSSYVKNSICDVIYN